MTGLLMLMATRALDITIAMRRQAVRAAMAFMMMMILQLHSSAVPVAGAQLGCLAQVSSLVLLHQ